MIRRFTTSLLTTLALGSVLNMVYPAQAASLMTRHLQDAVLNGQAKQVGRLPESQSMRIVLVLPLRNQDALESSLQDLYDPIEPVLPPVAHGGTVHLDLRTHSGGL